MARKILMVITLAVVILSLIGCQTVQGIGKDITYMGKAGEKILEKP